MFFVISGYLISLHIIYSLLKNNFIFLIFYCEVIKRIFLSLAVLLITRYMAGWFIFFLNKHMNLGKHIAAGSGFISNYIYWSESGYFNHATEAKSLLFL